MTLAEVEMDRLYRELLTHIAEGEPCCGGGESTAELCREALRAESIDFPRWCA